MITRIKEEFKIFLKIGEEKDIKVHTYGLTGAGIYFFNSTIKTLLRLNLAASRFSEVESYFKNAKESNEGASVKLSDKSWFEIRCIRDQNVYLQLIDNDLSPEYNGMIFKVRFQHYNTRREYLLGDLLNSYLYMDKNKFLPIALFWLFFLKVNGLIGEKKGFLSSTTYLMMLINYL